jgi:hypothetical protein
MARDLAEVGSLVTLADLLAHVPVWMTPSMAHSRGRL